MALATLLYFSQIGAFSLVTTTPIVNSNLLAIILKLQKSPQAMHHVQTVHVVLRGKGTIQINGTLLPAFARQTRQKT